MLERHGKKIFFSLLLAVLVYAGLLLVSDYTKLLAVLRDFRWELIPIVVALTLFNYLLRFAKWHYYLHVVGVRNLFWFDSLLIFFSGFSMTITPAKSGELLKSFLVRQRVGAPLAATAPIILAERMTDGLALLFLAGFGLFLFEITAIRLFMAAVLVSAIVAVALVQNRPLARRVGAFLARFAFLEERIHHLQRFYDSSYELLRLKTLAIAIGLGFVSWSGECLALAVVLEGLGLPFSWTLVALSAFAMGFATLAGSILLVPGGLGVAEGSIDGLLLTFGHPPYLPAGEVSQPVSAAATLMIRFATLWFGFFLGLVCLFVAQRRMGAAELAVEPARPDQSPDLVG
jgi:glycosyltransferase 2 family protein